MATAEWVPLGDLSAGMLAVAIAATVSLPSTAFNPLIPSTGGRLPGRPRVHVPSRVRAYRCHFFSWQTDFCHVRGVAFGLLSRHASRVIPYDGSRAG